MSIVNTPIDTSVKIIQSGNLLDDVSATGAIANVNNSAKGKPRIGQMKEFLDKARHIYWNLRYNDMQHMSEEFWEDQLMLLASMCPSIKLTNQYAVRDTTTNSGKGGVRFFDIVEIRSDKARVFELKANSITVDDIRSTIEKGSFIGSSGVTPCKNYLEVIKDAWPDKKTSLIFTSPFGINKNAAKLVQENPDISYIHYGDLARHIFMEITKQFPDEAQWRYEMIKNHKYRMIF